MKVVSVVTHVLPLYRQAQSMLVPHSFEHMCTYCMSYTHYTLFSPIIFEYFYTMWSINSVRVV